MLRPKIEIPEWPHVQREPGSADQGRGSVCIVMQNELSTMRRKMTDEFGILRRLNDLESEFRQGHKLDHSFLEYRALTKDTLALCVHKIPRRCSCDWIGQSEPKEPKAWR